MSITAILFLIIYFIGVAVLLLVSVLNFFPVIRYGFLNRLSLTITFVFLGVFLGIVLVTLFMVKNTDWHQPVFSSSTVTNSSNTNQ